MTESQAKLKWCPMVRTLCTAPDASLQAVPANRLPDGDFTGTHCIGSECMMWRWERDSKHVDFDGDWARKVGAEIEAGWHTITFHPLEENGVCERNTEHGYCGLAALPGRP